MPTTDELTTSLAESTNKLLTTANANTKRIISSQEQLALDHKSQLEVIVKQLSAQYEQTNQLLATLTTKSLNTDTSIPKISFPTFDGSNPSDWIFQANNHFNSHSTPTDQRVALSAFYVTGDALSWYKHLANNRLLGTWPEFSRALELRFGPSTYQNHEATLFKLNQTTTLAAYQTEFERVSSCAVGLSEQTLKNCFISGLKQEIQNELALHNPQTLHETYGLAKLIEHKLSTTQKTTNLVIKPVVSTSTDKYSCKGCRKPIAIRCNLLSKNFKAKSGQAYMFSEVMKDVVLGEKREQLLMTGQFEVADVCCGGCKEVLGWKYLKSFSDLQRFKIGRFIIEKAKVLREYS